MNFITFEARGYLKEVIHALRESKDDKKESFSCRNADRQQNKDAYLCFFQKYEYMVMIPFATRTEPKLPSCAYLLNKGVKGGGAFIKK